MLNVSKWPLWRHLDQHELVTEPSDTSARRWAPPVEIPKPTNQLKFLPARCLTFCRP